MSTTAHDGRTLDTAEVDRFRRMADAWWDEAGKFRPLHQIGPARLAFIREHLVERFGRDATMLRPLGGLAVLDIGCGGGLVSEPMARMGATVVGIDPGEETIAVARAHAAQSGLAIDYRSATIEALAAQGARFDAVLCLEVVEHVPDVAAFLGSCAAVLKPGGVMILSTINRTLKSFALAIVGAEYVLGWLPRGTHRWDRFVTPEEFERALRSAGLAVLDQRGMVYAPLTDRWSLGDDTDVNYLVAACAP